MRQLKPELSIVTTASGRSARIAATVSRTRRKMIGARGKTSAIPATAMSLSGRGCETLLLHALPADPGDSEIAIRTLTQRGDQSAAKGIA